MFKFLVYTRGSVCLFKTFVSTPQENITFVWAYSTALEEIHTPP